MSLLRRCVRSLLPSRAPAPTTAPPVVIPLIIGARLVTPRPTAPGSKPIPFSNSLIPGACSRSEIPRPAISMPAVAGAVAVRKIPPKERRGPRTRGAIPGPRMMSSMPPGMSVRPPLISRQRRARNSAGRLDVGGSGAWPAVGVRRSLKKEVSPSPTSKPSGSSYPYASVGIYRPKLAARPTSGEAVTPPA